MRTGNGRWRRLFAAGLVGGAAVAGGWLGLDRSAAGEPSKKSTTGVETAVWTRAAAVPTTPPPPIPPADTTPPEVVPASAVLPATPVPTPSIPSLPAPPAVGPQPPTAAPPPAIPATPTVPAVPPAAPMPLVPQPPQPPRLPVIKAAPDGPVAIPMPQPVKAPQSAAPLVPSVPPPAGIAPPAPPAKSAPPAPPVRVPAPDFNLRPSNPAHSVKPEAPAAPPGPVAPAAPLSAPPAPILIPAPPVREPEGTPAGRSVERPPPAPAAIGPATVPRMPDPPAGPSKPADPPPGDRTMTPFNKTVVAAVIGSALAFAPAKAVAQDTNTKPVTNDELKKQLDEANRKLTDLQKDVKRLNELLEGRRDEKGYPLPSDPGMVADLKRLRDRIEELERTMKSSTSLRPGTGTVAPAPALTGRGTVRVVNEYATPVSIVVNSTNYRVEPNSKLDIDVPIGTFSYHLLQAGIAPTTSVIKEKEVVTLRIK